MQLTANAASIDPTQTVPCEPWLSNSQQRAWSRSSAQSEACWHRRAVLVLLQRRRTSKSHDREQVAESFLIGQNGGSPAEVVRWAQQYSPSEQSSGPSHSAVSAGAG